MLERMSEPEKRTPIGMMDRMYMSRWSGRGAGGSQGSEDCTATRRSAQQALTVILTSSRPFIRGVNCRRSRVPMACSRSGKGGRSGRALRACCSGERESTRLPLRKGNGPSSERRY